MSTNYNDKNIVSPFAILKKIGSHLTIGRKKQLILVFFLTLFVSLTESISLAMLVPFISFFISPETYLFNPFFEKIFLFLNIDNNKQVLALVSLVFVTIAIVSGILKLKFIKHANLASQNVTHDFRIKMFNFLISQEYSYYFKHGTNDIMSNVSQKTGSLTTLVFSSINILNAITISVPMILVLIFNEPFYTPVIILSICIFFLSIFKLRSRAVLKKGKKIDVNTNLIIHIFENTVGYLPEIIIYNLKNFYSVIMRKTSDEIAKSNAEVLTIAASPRVYVEVFILVFVVAFIYFAGFSERTLESNLSYLAILAFAAQKCLPLINSIFHLSVNFRASAPQVQSFLNILENGKEETIEEKHYKRLNFKKSIKLDKLSYKYSQDLPNILNNISLEINKGEKVAIKGETGVGKSTLINLISGLINPTEGKVLIDNTEINSENIKNWQKNIAIVPQTIFLNDASILENIAIAINFSLIDVERVKACAKLAQIDKMIENLPNKYNEKVGERGIRLSGGQRQRIGVARALYRNASLIILDEPTNALDLETENLIMDSITKLKKDITVIMISHSNNSLKYFDKIIDLNELK